MKDSLDWLMTHAERYPLLTAEHEIHLARQVQEWLILKEKPKLTPKERAKFRKGKRAYDAFFMSNIRLVVMIANKYVKRAEPHLTIEDLVQEGLFYLERAIAKFDPMRGYKFSTYAFNWIRQGVNRAIENQARMIRLPVHSQTIMRKASAYCDQRMQESGKQPPLADIAENIGCSLDQLKLALMHANNMISLNVLASVHGGNERNPVSLIDVIADEREQLGFVDEYNGFIKDLTYAVDMLPPREKEVVIRRYLQPVPDTYDAIGQDHGVTRERIRALHANALSKMRDRLTKLATAEDIDSLKCA